MSTDCLDCALFECHTCAENNREWYYGACCCGMVSADETIDDCLDAWEDDDQVSA